MSLNGLVLGQHFLPEEVVGYLLTFVSWDDLLQCRLVCHLWKRLIDTLVGIDKLNYSHNNLRLSFESPSYKNSLKSDNVPFYLCYAIGHNVFGTNLLKNSFGEAVDHTCRAVNEARSWLGTGRFFLHCSNDCPKFQHWKVVASRGDGWIVEDDPVGSEALPEIVGGTSCFVTSYGPCKKYQDINLKQCGLSDKIMDEIRPNIEVSEWYAKRFDCGIIYILRVFLLNSANETVDQFCTEIEDRLGDNCWHQISHTFKNYKAGVRCIRFEHEGTDTQFWAGHYGSKMAGACVLLRLPTDRKLQQPS